MDLTTEELRQIILEELGEVYSDKQRRYMCAMSKRGADRPEGLSQAEAEEMCKGPMKKEALDEKCQKGYKTHPTRKTKKMFGKRYRNCVKAEENKNPRIPRKKGQPAKSDKHSDLYTDEDPKGTIKGLGFKDEAKARSSVAKIKKSNRSHAHKTQAAIAMEQRAKAAGKTKEAAIFRKFIEQQKKKTKAKNKNESMELEEKRKKAGTESSKESSLRDWFGRKGAKGKKKGWVDCNAPDGKGGYKSCGRSSGEKRKKYPACRPTPGACKERGKGKSWGKKASKRKKK